ncbi:MAG: hypothetical protein PHG48_04510 [Eubacteriales bacterium]|nr:hypothetical protein [Eubacteriales bacterium]
METLSQAGGQAANSCHIGRIYAYREMLRKPVLENREPCIEFISDRVRSSGLHHMDLLHNDLKHDGVSRI